MINKGPEIISIILIILRTVLQHNLLGSGLKVLQNIINNHEENVDQLECRLMFLT